MSRLQVMETGYELMPSWLMRGHLEGGAEEAEGVAEATADLQEDGRDGADPLVDVHDVKMAQPDVLGCDRPAYSKCFTAGSCGFLQRNALLVTLVTQQHHNCASGGCSTSETVTQREPEHEAGLQSY